VRRVRLAIDFTRQRAKRALQPVYRGPVIALAAVRRRGLAGVSFVAVTGSCGKTTTKDLIAAACATRLRGGKSHDSTNNVYNAARTILRLPRGSRFCVQEISAAGPGQIERALALLLPRIGVVTNVGGDHWAAFRSLEATAAEKGKLVAALPADGVAVLNADDPHVLAMASRCAGSVLTYGLSPDAMLRGGEVRSAWPERLSLSVTHGGDSLRVETQLCGVHWASSVLAALAAGLALGVPLADGARGIAGVEPWLGRMSPMETEDGVTFLRDDWKAPYWSIPAALEVLRTARAQRKIVVLGTLSDYPGNAGRKYAALARQALEAADHVVFVGRLSGSALRAGKDREDASIAAFPRMREAATHLREFLRTGDLVLLKGSHRADHLARVALAQRHDVACWIERCDRQIFCDRCVRLTTPAGQGRAGGGRKTGAA
jgi:UDP-N-acetylmuramyl pentapeptide synthase